MSDPRQSLPTRVADAIAYGLIAAMGWLLAITTPYGPQVLCKVLGWITWNASSRRTVILRNLHHAFPERDEAWRRRIGRISAERMFELFLLPIAMRFWSRERLRRRLQVDPETAKRLLDVGAKGGFVLTPPHMTLTESLVTLPVLVPGHAPIVALYRPLDFGPAERYVKQAREQFGTRLHSRKEGLLQAKENLVKGGVAGILFDQHAGSSGALLLFCGRVCSATDLPGLLAAKTKVTAFLLLPMRKGFWRGVIEAHPVDVAPRADAITVGTHRMFEGYLAASDEICADWFWAHQRWKVLSSPRERFALKHKRSYLDESLRQSGETALPKRLFTVVRLPANPAMQEAFSAAVPALRQSRPDIHLTAIYPRGSGAIGAPSYEATHSFGDDTELQACLKQLKQTYPDIYLCLDPDADGAAEGKACGAVHTYGMIHQGRKTRGYRQPLIIDASLPDDSVAALELIKQCLRHYGAEIGA